MKNFWRGWSLLGQGMTSIFEHMGSIVTFGIHPRVRNYQVSKYNSVEEALRGDLEAVGRDWQKVMGDLDVALAKSKTADDMKEAFETAESAFKEAVKNSQKGNSNGQN